MTPTTPEDLSKWQAPQLPNTRVLKGVYCHLAALNADKHKESLWEAFSEAEDNSLWDYLPYGPFDSQQSFNDFIDEKQHDTQCVFFSIMSTVQGADAKALGLIAFLNIHENIGSLEIGHVAFSPSLQRTLIATETIYLMMQYTFTLGYRRCEWKCNSLNIPSKNAAARFGFQYEGRFRQATIVKGKNRDTDWYSVIDKEWPRLQTGYQQWLSSDNIDAQGQQRKPLRDFLSD